MQDLFRPSPLEEAKFNVLFEAECERKEKLMAEFEKMEKKERRRKNPADPILKKKYERVTKGLFFIEKITRDCIHLIGKDEKKLGVLQVPPAVSELSRVNDGLEGVFAFRDGSWRVQFLISIESSTADFMPEDS